MHCVNQTWPLASEGALLTAEGNGSSMWRQCKETCSFNCSFKTREKMVTRWPRYWWRKAIPHLSLDNLHDLQTAAAQRWSSCLTSDVFTCRTAVLLGKQCVHTASREKPEGYSLSDDFFWRCLQSLAYNLVLDCWENMWKVCQNSLYQLIIASLLIEVFCLEFSLEKFSAQYLKHAC